MIILDIEASGLTGREGICQIGAFEYENPDSYFLEDCRIDDEDGIMEAAVKVNGRDESILRDSSKQSQKQLIVNYLDWVSKLKDRIILGSNVSWDLTMIQDKCFKYGLNKRFWKEHKHRGLDLFTIAQQKYFEIYGKYFVGEYGIHKMNLEEVMKFCGIESPRINIDPDGKISHEGKVHDALEDCRINAECFSRLSKGAGLFPEYSKFLIPEYLKK